MRTVLRRPEFRLLFGGLLASMAAESILLLALAIWVKDLTGSDGLAGATIFAVIAPMTLAPLVGWLVDRYPRRPFFVVANLVTAVLLTPLLAVRDRGDVWIIYVVAALYGLSYITLSAVLSGLIRQLVPVELLAEANGVLQTVRQGLRLIGPLAGAGLYAAVGGWMLAVIGMVGFLSAAVVVSLIRTTETPPAGPGLRWPAELSVGLRHLAGEPALRRALLGYGLGSLAMGFSESLIFAYVDQGSAGTPRSSACWSPCRASADWSAGCSPRPWYAVPARWARSPPGWRSSGRPRWRWCTRTSGSASSRCCWPGCRCR